jgi:hypothetical protein
MPRIAFVLIVAVIVLLSARSVYRACTAAVAPIHQRNVNA